MGRPGIPSLMPAIGMGLGIWLSYAIQPDHLVCLAAFLIASVLLGISAAVGLRMPAQVYAGLVCIAFSSLGSWVMAGRLPANQPDHFIHHTGPEDQQLLLELKERLRPTAFSKRWIAEARQVKRKQIQGRVLLQVPLQAEDSLWLPGDLIQAVGRIAPVPGPLNPHQFDYAAYLKTLGIYGQLRLQSGSFLQATPGKRGLIAELSRMRQKLASRVHASGLSPDARSTLAALVLGDRTRLDPQLHASYQRAGAAHLLAVSGLHVGVLMGLAAWLLKPLARSRGGSILRLVLALSFLWGYAFLAGFGASVVRASILFSFIGYAHLNGKGREGLHLLGLAALVMLGLINPYWLFQPGFQLSFGAVWAIYSFYPAMMRRWPWNKGPARFIGELFCLGNAAQLGVLPISLYYFHQIPLLYWVANLLIVPIMGGVLALGFILVGCLAAGWYPTWAVALFEWALFGINTGVRWIGSLEAGLVTGIRWSAVESVALLSGLLFLSAWLARGGRWGLRMAASCVLALQCWQLHVAILSTRKSEWIVPHRTGATGFWVREGLKLRVFSPEPGAYSYAVKAYETAEGIREIRQDSLGQAYRLGDYRLWVVGPGSRFPDSGPPPEILLLSGSPKVHLDRVLQTLQPDLVIADGSNYRSFAQRWEASCQSLGIPFHNTALQGAYSALLVPVSGRSPSAVSSAARQPGQ